MSKGLDKNLNLSVFDLVKRTVNEFEKRAKEAKEYQRKNIEELVSATAKERSLMGKIGKKKQKVRGLTKELEAITSKVEAAERKKASKDIAREADLKSGKVSLKEFMEKGKRDIQIELEIVEAVNEETLSAITIIRKLNLEILSLELELANQRNRVRALIIQPGRLLVRHLSESLEIAKIDMASFQADVLYSRDEVTAIQNKLQLTQGRSLAPGYHWFHVTPHEAERIALDPIMPESLLPLLRSELAKYQDHKFISVAYFQKSQDIQIMASVGREKAIREAREIKEGENWVLTERGQPVIEESEEKPKAEKRKKAKVNRKMKSGPVWELHKSTKKKTKPVRKEGESYILEG